MSGLSHLDGEGRARMVDVGDKPVTTRRAEVRAALDEKTIEARRALMGEA